MAVAIAAGCGSTVRRDAPIGSLIVCNCSVCRRKGVLHLPVQDSDLTVGQGRDALGLFQWAATRHRIGPARPVASMW